LGSTKERWDRYCASLGKKPGAAVTKAIEYQLAKADINPSPKIYRQAEGLKKPKQRFEILLTASEKMAIQERARIESCSARRWIVDAIRVGLTREPQFSTPEIDALGESNYQLLSVGRNLNQVVRNINKGHYDDIAISHIDALAQLIDEHTDIVSSAIGASLERWKIKSE